MYFFKMEKERSDRKLKYLDFVRTIALNALVFALNLYEFAKRISGPLKFMVVAVERVVTTVFGPVYEKFKGFPDDVLLFVDKKIDEVIKIFDDSSPPLVKKLISNAISLIQKSLEVAKNFVKITKSSGLFAAVSYAGALFTQLVLSQLLPVFNAVIQSELFFRIGGIVVPIAAYWCKKYNTLIKSMKATGFKIFGSLRLVPVDELVLAYKAMEAAALVARKKEAALSGMTGLSGRRSEPSEKEED